MKTRLKLVDFGAGVGIRWSVRTVCFENSRDLETYVWPNPNREALMQDLAAAQGQNERTITGRKPDALRRV